MVISLKQGANDLHMVRPMAFTLHHLSASLKPTMVLSSGAGLPRMSPECMILGMILKITDLNAMLISKYKNSTFNLIIFFQF